MAVSNINNCEVPHHVLTEGLLDKLVAFSKPSRQGSPDKMVHHNPTKRKSEDHQRCYAIGLGTTS